MWWCVVLHASHCLPPRLQVVSYSAAVGRVPEALPPQGLCWDSARAVTAGASLKRGQGPSKKSLRVRRGAELARQKVSVIVGDYLEEVRSRRTLFSPVLMSGCITLHCGHSDLMCLFLCGLPFKSYCPAVCPPSSPTPGLRFLGRTVL